jgi:diguanylate cyclase (GGDEF)-like protein
LATWIVLLGALATLPLCAFLYASYRAQVTQLRVDAQVVQQREATGAARALHWQLQVIASQLHFIDKLATLNGGTPVLPDGELMYGLLGIAREPVAVCKSPSSARPGTGSAWQMALSPFVTEQKQDVAFLTVPRAGRPGCISGKVSLSQLLGQRTAEGRLPAFLIDQTGRIVGGGVATQTSRTGLPVLLTGVDGRGDVVDLTRLRTLPAVADIQGGWTIAVPGAAADLAQREATLRRRYVMGGALSLCLGLVLLHFVALRLRSGIDEVVTDFGELDSQGPSSVISEFAEIGGALATARAKAGRTAAELERAKHDSLTGLPGRELFLQLAHAQLNAARAMDDHGIALLYIDLDGFKAVNDNFGHRRGDKLLQDVAATLRQCVRTPDAVGRIGGDEFVVCFAAPRQRITELAERACTRITEEVARLGNGVGCSVGWATCSTTTECNLAELLDEADAAMYLVKSARKHHLRTASVRG